MKILFTTVFMLLFSIKSNAQSYLSTDPQHRPISASIFSMSNPNIGKTITRTVIDRYALILIQYDNATIREMDIVARKDSLLKDRTSYRIDFEMPGLHFNQRLRSDTLEITNYDAVRFIKIKDKVYALKP